jgi:hypothetical protein
MDATNLTFFPDNYFDMVTEKVHNPVVGSRFPQLTKSHGLLP